MRAAARGTRQAAPVLMLTCLLAVSAVAAQSRSQSSSTAARRGPEAPAPYGYDIVHRYPHDRSAFTQGLLYRDGFLYESTGMNGHSTLRKVRIETGQVVRQRALDERYFAEGLTDVGNRLVQLTWSTNIGFVYDLATFEPRGTFAYPGEGWGLAYDGRRLIMSDGTAALRLLDPVTFREQGRLHVTDGGQPVDRLNELEVVRGQVYANVWLTDRIAMIDPATGHVAGWIDLAGLRPRPGPAGDDVLNGIAYDARGDRLFVTGKLWPSLYEIRLRPIVRPSAK